MKTKIVFFSVIMVLLCSCSKRNEIISFDDFGVLYPDVNFNGEIKLEEDPSAPNNRLIGSEVDLILINLSEKYIEFNIDENFHIYRFDSELKKWKKVENLFNYRGPNQVLPPLGSPGITDAFALSWPNLIDNGNPMQIRIVAIGTDVEDNRYRVGTYFDVTLIPFE
jgi:hypothetical protein